MHGEPRRDPFSVLSGGKQLEARLAPGASCGDVASRPGL